MSIRINRETVRSFGKICSLVQEQSLELDYVLPDYYPEIFRIVRCTAEPMVTSASVSGDRVSYDLAAVIKVIYLPEGESGLRCIEQKLSFTRTAPLDKEAVQPDVTITPRADHIICRAVSKRRIDVRGALMICIDAVGDTESQAVSDVFGGGVHLKKLTCHCPSARARVSKRCTVSDEFELGSDLPPIGSILRSEASIASFEKKVISGRAAAKGDIKVRILYTPSSGDDHSPVTALFTMPYSCPVEIEGAEEGYDIRMNGKVIACRCSPVSKGDGDCISAECSVDMLISCESEKITETDIAVDEYSTAHSSSHETERIMINGRTVSVDEVLSVKGLCWESDSPAETVSDVWCNPDRLTVSVKDGKAVLTGQVRLSVMGKNQNGDIIVCDTDIPVEHEIAADGSFDDNCDIHITAEPVSCGYTITSDGKAEIRADIRVSGWITGYTAVDAVTSINVDEDSPSPVSHDYAMRLYFAQSGEELWDIAKRYGASVDMVMEENDLDKPVTESGGMLLIPIE